MTDIHYTNMNNFDWDDLRYFLGVAEHGSLSAAAKWMNSNQPTVGRHIDALESALGMRLFQRTPTGLILTQEGTMLLEQAETVRSGMLNIQRLSGGKPQQPRGSVRLALPEGICHEVVVPALGRFLDACPHIRLTLNVSSRTADLTRGEADIAIRLFRPRQSDLVVRRLGRLEMGLFASPAYLGRHGTPARVADLKTHSIIAYGDELAGQAENRWLLERSSAERIVLRSDSTTTRQRATGTGLGISVQPRFPAGPVDGLVPVLRQSALPGYEIWLAYHRDLRGVYRVRAVIDFLASLFAWAGPDPEAGPTSRL